jgi:hypothetical protein
MTGEIISFLDPKATVIRRDDRTGLSAKILRITNDIPATFSDTDLDDLSSVSLHIHQQKSAFLSNPRKDFTRQSSAKVVS